MFIEAVGVVDVWFEFSVAAISRIVEVLSVGKAYL